MPTRQHSEQQPVAVSQPPASFLANQRKWLLDTALNGLGARNREVLVRFYLQEQTQEQICAEMGITETQFGRLKSEAQRELSRKRARGRAAASQAAPTERSVVDIDRVIPIVAHAVAVFGDERKASHWSATPLGLLGDRSPAQILASGGDIEAVDQILTRIEHNIPS